LKRWEK